MNNRTCFLIDDDEDDRDIFAMALEDVSEAYMLRTAANGLEAFTIIDNDASFIPDLIFLDMNMPYMSGLECLKRIRQYAHLQHVPVIIYTTSSYEKDVAETQESGATHFLVKPSGISKLSKTLSSLVHNQDLPYYIPS